MANIIQEALSIGYGGLEMVALEFHQWLLRRGHESLLIVVENSPLHKELIRGGFKDSIFTVGGGPDRFSRAYHVRKEHDADNVAVLFHRHPTLMGLRCQRLKAKVSMLSHTFYNLKKRDPLHRYIFAKVDEWIALTEAHKANLIETTGVDAAKVSIIPNGVDLNKFVPRTEQQKSNSFQIGIVGRLDRQKGQDVALQALRYLKDHGDSLTLRIFGSDTPGENPFVQNLKKIVRDLALENNVIFEGFIPQVAKKMSELDLLWVPSHRETFGRCIIEAMACGVPVVASAAGGVIDIIRDKENGFLFKSKDASDLYRVTKALIHATHLRQQVTARALVEVKEKYDQEEICSRLLSVITR